MVGDSERAVERKIDVEWVSLLVEVCFGLRSGTKIFCLEKPRLAATLMGIGGILAGRRDSRESSYHHVFTVFISSHAFTPHRAGLLLFICRVKSILDKRFVIRSDSSNTRRVYRYSCYSEPHNRALIAQ